MRAEAEVQGVQIFLGNALLPEDDLDLPLDPRAEARGACEGVPSSGGPPHAGVALVVDPALEPFPPAFSNFQIVALFCCCGCRCDVDLPPRKP